MATLWWVLGIMAITLLVLLLVAWRVNRSNTPKGKKEEGETEEKIAPSVASSAGYNWQILQQNWFYRVLGWVVILILIQIFFPPVIDWVVNHPPILWSLVIFILLSVISAWLKSQEENRRKEEKKANGDKKKDAKEAPAAPVQSPIAGLVTLAFFVLLAGVAYTLYNSSEWQKTSAKSGSLWERWSKVGLSSTFSPAGDGIGKGGAPTVIKTDHMVAKVGEWSLWVTAPANARALKMSPADTASGGDIKVENTSGESLVFKKGEVSYDKLTSLLHGAAREIRFQSLGDKEVPLMIEWYDRPL